MQIIKLESNDNKIFEVKKEIAEKSLTIKNMLDDLDDENENDIIPLMNVKGDILKKVIEFCEYWYNNESDMTNIDTYTVKEDLSKWEINFCYVDQGTLFDLILAANYLDIKPLLDLTCLTVALMIQDNSIEEIRKKFGIENDFTAEEEKKIMEENEWCKDL